MPQAVTHILLPLILMSLIKDSYDKKHKEKLSLHYILIAGLGGVLPDIDIPISVALRFLGFQDWWIHKTFTHSIFFPLLLLVLFIILRPVKAEARICNIGKHKLKLSTVFLMLAFGALMHLLLDTIAGDQSLLLYPFLVADFGFNLFSFIPLQPSLIAPLLDGILLVIWIIYLELKHKISDFI